MSIEIIEYKGIIYPAYQASGHASRFIQPFALEVCKGIGLDIGCGKSEWALPGSIAIDLRMKGCIHDAYNLPKAPHLNPGDEFYNGADGYCYIFSSHCLEHLPDWVRAIRYWTENIRTGGILFLYLPSYEQVYWRPWNNTKHHHIFTPQIIRDFMHDIGYKNIFSSERDLNHSFAIFGEKK